MRWKIAFKFYYVEKATMKVGKRNADFSSSAALQEPRLLGAKTDLILDIDDYQTDNNLKYTSIC